MPRKMRIHYRGAMYHVMLRGNFKNIIFKTENDRLHLYKLFDVSTKKYGYSIHLFCLMDNHIHIVVEVDHIPLRKIIQSISATYARYFNRSLNRIGHLFQGRYRAKLISNDKYLLELCYYIHQNPKSAKMVDNLDNYLWSSHLAYLGYEKYEWLKIDHVMELIKKSVNAEKNHYQLFISQRDSYYSQPVFCTFDEENGLTILDSVVNKISKTNLLDFKHIGLSRLAILVCQYLNVALIDVQSDKRCKELVIARNLITYVAHYRSRHFLCDIAYYLNRNPDTLSRTLNRFLMDLESKKSVIRLIRAVECYVEEMVGNDPTM